MLFPTMHFLFPNKRTIQTARATLSNLCLLSVSIILSSCHIVPDQGPTGMNKIQKQQLEGKVSSDHYQIIDISKDNIKRYNKKQYKQTSSTPTAQASKTYNDLLRPYDKLALLVIDTAEQGAFAKSKGPVTFGPLEVPDDGRINIPYAGELHVTGKTINTIQKEISDKYSTIFNTAQVSLSRVGRQPLRASVIGLARKPGQHSIERKGVTLVELIARSGGTTEEPYLCEYLIHRNNKTYNLSNDQITKRKILAQDGDLIEIKRSEAHSITVMGSVNRPGNHKFPKSHCHLSDFLGASRGISLNHADATGVFIFRKVGAKTHLYRFNLQKPEGMIHASKFNIHANDILYVTEAPLAKWGRVIRGALPFGQLQSAVNTASFGN